MPNCQTGVVMQFQLLKTVSGLMTVIMQCLQNHDIHSFRTTPELHDLLHLFYFLHLFLCLKYVLLQALVFCYGTEAILVNMWWYSVMLSSSVMITTVIILYQFLSRSGHRQVPKINAIQSHNTQQAYLKPWTLWLMQVKPISCNLHQS